MFFSNLMDVVFLTEETSPLELCSTLREMYVSRSPDLDILKRFDSA